MKLIGCRKFQKYPSGIGLLTNDLYLYEKKITLHVCLFSIHVQVYFNANTSRIQKYCINLVHGPFKSLATFLRDQLKLLKPMTTFHRCCGKDHDTPKPIISNPTEEEFPS